MPTAYSVKLQQFEGPLDLLLHLIRVNEFDIFNIDVFMLTSQYIGFLRTVEYEDLADASEFLEMAATLIEIKTKMLLPGQEKSDGDDEDEEDPRKTLQERRAARTPSFGRLNLESDIEPPCEWQRLKKVSLEAPLIETALVILYRCYRFCAA